MLACRDCQAPLQPPSDLVLNARGNCLPFCPKCATRRRNRGEIPIFSQSVAGVMPDPEYDTEVLTGLSDPDLLKRLEQAFESVLYVNEAQKISAVSPRERPERWNNFAAAWNEATARGYTQADLGGAIKNLAATRGFLNELHEKLGKPESWNPDPGQTDTTWKQFEQLVGKLHAMNAENCIVTVDEKIPDRTTSTPRQVDVTLRFKKSLYDFLAIVECRHQKAAVTIGDVEAFIKKLEDVRGHKGVIVTSSGFDRGAVAKAEFHGIELCTLSRAIHLEWREHVREIVRSFPFPDEVTFEPVDPGGFSNAPTGHAELSFGDFRLCDPTGRDVEHLASLFSRLSLQLMKQRLAMPTQVTVHFDPPAVIRLDPYAVSVPIKAIKVVFVLETRTERRVIQQPTVTHRYDYRNVGTGEVRSFDLE